MQQQNISEKKWNKEQAAVFKACWHTIFRMLCMVLEPIPNPQVKMSDSRQNSKKLRINYGIRLRFKKFMKFGNSEQIIWGKNEANVKYEDGNHVVGVRDVKISKLLKVGLIYPLFNWQETTTARNLIHSPPFEGLISLRVPVRWPHHVIAQN